MSLERRRKQNERLIEAAVAKRLNQSWWRSVPAKLFALLCFVLAVLGVWPRIDVVPGQSLTQSEAFDVPFIITNNAYTSEKIDALFFVHKLVTQHIRIENTLVNFTSWNNQRLERGDSKTIVVPLLERGKACRLRPR
jgi:hypothetical protein